MMINAMLLFAGLVMLPAVICAHTDLTCEAAA